jgi:magnesium transporter
MPAPDAGVPVSRVVACAAYADGRRVADVPLADISEVLRVPDRFVWVSLEEPDAALLATLQEEFGLHELAVEDALRAHQRPKIEQYGDSLFIVLRTARTDPETGRPELGEAHFFLGQRFLVAVRHGPATFDGEVRARCEANPHLLAKGPGFALYALMDMIVDQYFPVVDALEGELEAIEEEIFGEEFTAATTERLYRLKKGLLDVKRAVAPLLEVCSRLTRFDLTTIHEDMHPYFRDVYDHTIRLNEMVDVLRELVTGALEAKLALVSVAQNESMKKLAAWGAIIGVPTLIAGVYGMNFEFMPELKWLLGYPFAMAAMVVACGYLYVHFKRVGWL